LGEEEMSSIHRILRVLVVAAVATAGLVARAEGAIIVSVSPTEQTANVGDDVFVDILVSGLTGPIGGFSAVLSFDDTILTGVNYTIDPDSNFDCATPGLCDASFGFGPGGGSPLDLFYAADPIAGQPTAFRLARIEFDAAANGVSPLTLSGVVLSSSPGNDDIFADQINNGRVCVGGPCPTAPEPTTFALFGAAAAAFGLRRFRRA
jgi:hypothetical protein